MKDKMTVTVNLKDGEQAFFRIEFNKDDFFKVVDAIDDLTLDSVQTSNLWVIV